MDNEKLLKRLQELEVEVQRLKMQVLPGASQTARVVKKSITFVLSYWTLLSFIVAIALAVFIKWKFDVDYFENYRTVAESRKISSFHQKLGEKLLLRQEWTAAEDAFAKALEADKNNTDASYGLVKSRIFKPLPGEQFVPVETQDTMIAYLREQRPDDADLDLLQAWRHWSQSQAAETRKCLEAALEKNPKFGAAQFFLSYMASTEGDVAGAIEWCRKGQENVPDDPNAMSNMGWLLLLHGKPAEALPMLERAHLSAGLPLTGLVRSDALRLTGNFTEARTCSRQALSVLTNEKLQGTRLTNGEWYYNFLPEKDGDTGSVKNGIYANTLQRKQSLAYLAFALDSALCGDVDAAAEAMRKVHELEPDSQIQTFYANKARATIHHAKLDPGGQPAALLMALVQPPEKAPEEEE